MLVGNSGGVMNFKPNNHQKSMKSKAYYVQKPNGELVKDGDFAIAYMTIEAARKAAKEHLGIIGRWDYNKNEFVPRRRA